MLARRTFLLGLAALALARRAAVASDGGEFKLIVHPENPITSIDEGRLRDAYLKKAASWSNGRIIRAVDLPPRYGAREQFGRRVLKKTPSQLRYYWNRQVFTGKGAPPMQVDSASAAVAFVLDHPAAVAYLPRDADAGGAKVIALRGG
jgi:ABC-type phosphate transport system substrate-binding protein